MKKICPQLFCLALLAHVFPATAAEKPNIVYILCDDLGYGDIHCLAPKTSKIPTPNADKLASQGMIFTDAHSGSSVCSPTRYGLMTGRYSWRTRLQKGVVTGFAPSLIAKDRPTVASFLKSQGYTTGVIGKWHLDLQYLNPNTGHPYSKKNHKTPPIGATIPDGPVHRGFDYYHGFHHARHMEAVIENDRVIEHDLVVNMLPRLTRKSVEFIARQAGSNEPFFLYVPLGSPHAPIVPTSEWEGKSGLGKYGDFVMQTDNVVGEISAALKKHGLESNTLVIFTSDNGCSKVADIPALARQGHQVSAHLRGSKADIWDGGHRIPFIVRWPGKVEPDTTSDQLICLTDLFATTAEITGQKLPSESCEDSVSFLPALAGKKIKTSRAGVIHHSVSGHFAYRQGKWKLALAKASGGWTSPKEASVSKGTPKAQLYDMAADPGEKNNLYLEESEIAKCLLAQLEKEVGDGRSTAGPDSGNDVDNIVLWKSERGDDKKKRKTKRESKARAKPIGAMPTAAKKTPTNIVLIIADDCTYRDLEAYGGQAKTPNMNRLAAEGLKFSRCFQAAPMCSPTRHCLYTGIYPVKSGAYPNHTFVKDGTKSIAHYLQEAGYRVALSGKTHIAPRQSFPFEYSGKKNPDVEVIDKLFGDCAKSNKPFALFACSNEPHSPWNQGDASKYPPADVELPPILFDTEQTRRDFSKYLAEITYFDWQVGQIMKLLDKHGLADNTFLIVLSEQGNSFPFAKWTCYDAGLQSGMIARWPGEIEAGSQTDAMVEYVDMVPTMLAAARVRAPEILDGRSFVPVLKGESIKHKDFVYGLQTTRGIHSGADYFGIRSVRNERFRYIRNLTPEVDFKNVAFESESFRSWEAAAANGDQRAATLVNRYSKRPAVELYDSVNDPWNEHNLANQPEYQQLLKQLSHKLDSWMAQQGDQGQETELAARERQNRGRNADSKSKRRRKRQ